MALLNKIRRVIERPERLIIGIQLRLAHLLGNQKMLLRGLYWMNVGNHLNLRKPKSFTEKIQWLKLHDHNPKYHLLVDKYEVKKIVSNAIGSQYVIPTLGIWDSFDQIDFDGLPDQFVLKTTNGGGSTGVVICRDKSTFDKESAKKKLASSMKHDIYKSSGEWAYKGVPPRIIAETLLSAKTVSTNNINGLDDFKFYCFDGEPIYCQVIRDRSSNETIDFYDMNWNHMPFVGLNPYCANGSIAVSRPANLENMKSICRHLSEGIKFTRIDLYLIDSKEYFGEITFYPNSGFGAFSPNEWNIILGDLLRLNDVVQDKT